MQTFGTPEPISVELSLSGANVQITASDRLDTTVDVQPTNAASTADVALAEQTIVEFAGGRLRVATPKGWRNWLPWVGHESIDVHIEVPTLSNVQGATGHGTLRSTGRLGECQYKTGAGSVRVDESGTTRIIAGAGDISIDRATGTVAVRTTGKVHLGAIDGSAVVKNANGATTVGEVTGALRVNGANGAIDVARAHADVVVKSAHGDVRVGTAERGAIVAETASGTVDIGVREGVAAWLDLDTGFGAVRNELDVTDAPASGDDKVEIRVRTAFGDITIHRAVADAA